MWTIYALVDPRTNQIRYVGQTQNHPSVRLEGHLQKRDENREKLRWLDELRALNIKPIVVALQYAATLDDALRLEGQWIRRGLQSEWPLTNAGIPQRRRYQFRGTSANPKPTKPPAMSLSAWYDWTAKHYLPSHLELLQLDSRGRGVGVKALAEAMAAECGKDIDAMKGTASEVAKRLRNEVHTTTGDRLGTDITGGTA